MDVRNVKLPWEEFQKTRTAVLSTWPTGREVYLEEALVYQKALPEHKVFANVMAKAEKQDRILLYGHGGRALLDEHIELVKAVETAGSDAAATSVDGLTRNNKYEESERGLEESKRLGRSTLSGFPIVAHGVKNCRKVIEAIGQPMTLKPSAVDNRLIHEIAFAGGFTLSEGGPLQGPCCYSAHDPIALGISNYQYVDRLTGFFEEMGAHIVRRIAQYNLGAGGVPPCIDILFAIIQSLLAAEQGVRYLMLANLCQGNMLQDIARGIVMEKLTKAFLCRFGYYDVKVYRDQSSWVGAQSRDEAKAWAELILPAATAVLGGFRGLVCFKTVEEGHGLPSIAATAAVTRACRHVIDILEGQRYPESEQLNLEADMLEIEARSVMEKILEIGDGDVAAGSIRAFELGVMDVPFSPNKYTLGKVLPARDSSGAVRFLEFGNLPFPQEVKDFHREKLAERGKAEGRSPGLEMVIDDVAGGLVRLRHDLSRQTTQAKEVHFAKKTLVMGVVGNDPHAIGNRLLAHALTNAGFKVVNLGTMVEPSEFIKATIETAADAILLGSLEGHGEIYCRDFRGQCEESGLRKDIIIYVGGHVVMGTPDWPQVEKRFREMGITRVYPPGTLPGRIIEDLKIDLAI
jgi:methylaspartate mutase epsilon subunit